MAALSQKRSCGEIMAQFKEFVWNPRTREFMGRTASSWALIISFYVVFYAFLTAVFALSMWVMLQTIDEHFPTYSDRLANPGLMIRPKTEGLEIIYDNETESSWQPYVKALDDMLSDVLLDHAGQKPETESTAGFIYGFPEEGPHINPPNPIDYNVSVQEQRGSVCTPGVYNDQNDPADVRNFPKKACRFDRTLLGECDGLRDIKYGYDKGQPCVLIKMNRVIKFLPGVIPSLSNHTVTVNCSATKLKSSVNVSVSTATNDELLGERRFFPSNGSSLGTIDLMFFPYYGSKAQVNYTQPLVAIKFLNPAPNIDLFVQCRVNAANIKSNDDKDKFSGRVIFKLRINKAQ